MKDSSAGYIRTGLIGYPIAKSLSPQIHNEFFTRTGLRGEYQLWPLADARRIPAFVNGVVEKNIRGFNVTIPYKNSIIDYLTEVDEMARAIGAVNTVVQRAGLLYGYNTDVFGVEKMLEINDIDPAGKTFLMYGCGGAARAVVKALAGTVRKIACVTRDTQSENCKHMQSICDKIEVCQTEQDIRNALSAADVVVNALPALISDEIFRSVCPDKSYYAAVDLNYHSGSVFSKQFSRSRVVCDGAAMLYYQAAKAFHLWTGVFPD